MGKNLLSLRQGQAVPSEKDPRSAIQNRAIPLEPRVMLDANLEWDLNSSTLISSALTAISELFEDQFSEVTSFLEQFDDAANTAFDVVDSLVDTAGSVSSDDLNAATEAVSRIREAIETIRSETNEGIEALIGGSFASDVAGDFNSYLNGYYTANAAAGSPSYGADFTAPEIQSVYNLDNFKDGTIESTLITLLASKDLGEASTATAQTAFNGLVAAEFGADLTGNLFGLSLEDIELNGTDIVTFTQGADNTSLSVDVALPQIIADFGMMIRDQLNDIGVPFDLAALGDGSAAISFDMSSLITVNGAVLEEVGLDIDNFNFAPLLEVGGAFTLPAGSELTLGFLNLEVSSFETAALKLFVDVAAPLNLGGKLVLAGAGALGFDFYGSGQTIAVGSQIKEIGSAVYTDIVADQEYVLAEMALAGSLEFSAISQSFTAGIILSSVVNSTGPAGRIQEFLNAADFDFSVNLDDPGLSTALADTLATTIETFAAMSSDQVVQFLKDIGETIMATLQNEVFALEIPLTDIRLSELMDEFAGFFGQLAQDFSINKSSLGFVEAQTGVDLAPEITSQVGTDISLAQLDALTGFDSLKLFVIADSTPFNAPIFETITLTGTDAVDGAKTAAERVESLAELFSVAMAAYGIEVTVGSNGGLRIENVNAAADKNHTFAIYSATPAGGTEDKTAITLGDLGFDISNLKELTYDGNHNAITDGTSTVFVDGASDLFIKFNEPATLQTLDKIDFSALSGVEALQFNLTIDGRDRLINLTSAGGWADIDALVASFDTAMGDAGIGITVSKVTSGADSSFSFALDAGEDRSISIGAASDLLLRALDVDGLISWVNAELSAAWPGAEIELTEDGEMIFRFPDITASLTLPDGATDTAYFSASDLGLGFLGDLNVSATLAANLNASVTSAIGIDIAGFGADIVGTGTGNALEEKSSFTDDLLDALLDNVFFTDLALTASVDGSATDITGSANVGLMSVVIGGANPSLNYMHINAQVEATIVGNDPVDGFNEKLTFRNLRDSVVDKAVRLPSGAYDYTEAPGLGSLLGRMELLGGIVTDGEGNGLDTLGDVVAQGADVQVVDAFSYVGGDQLVQFLMGMGDIKVTVAGISGINEDLIDGVNVSIVDLADIAETYDVALLSNDPAVLAGIEGLSGLEGGDILDTMSSIANVLVVVGETLSDKLPFLKHDIPLLNFSFSDQIDFAADFLDALQELRRDPQTGLDVVEAFLESIFGKDTVTLTWDTATKTLLFDLSFTFLEDYAKTFPFQVDLAEMLGAELENLLGEDLANIVTGMVDVGGDGRLVFDPLLSLDFSFGIDLNPTLTAPTNFAGTTIALSNLATVSSVNFRPGGGDDLRFSWTSTDNSGASPVVSSDMFSIDLSAFTALDEVVAAIDAQVKTEFGATVSFSHDPGTGLVTLTDSNSVIILDGDVTDLFGAADASSTDVAGTQVLALEAGFSDFTAALDFTLTIGTGDLAESFALSLAEDVARDKTGFVDALNDLLAATDVARSAISGSAVPGLGIALSQLMTVEVNGTGDIEFVGTNFSDANGYATIEFSVSGQDQSKTIEFRVEELGGSNIARLLGFTDIGDTFEGDMVSDILYVGVTVGAPRVFLDTDKTGIRASFLAGVDEGLNVQLGLGPLKIQVQNGKALINAGDGSGDPAYVALTINDIDGDAHADQYNLAHIFDIGNDPALEYADLFGFDAKVGIDIDLPFSDTIGLFDPADHSLSYQANLLSLVSGARWQDVDIGDLSATFDGDLISLFDGLSIDPSDFKFDIPTASDLAAYLSSINVLSILNDPLLVIEGVDMILQQMQSLFDDKLGSIELPIVGDAIGAGVTFFDDFRYSVLEPALAIAETPLADGSLPTTVDLLTGFINDKLNLVLGTTNETYLQAFLNTDGGTEDSFVYAVINFNAVIFDEMMDIDFDFGIPGFNLEVEQGSQIRMQLDYLVNIGFGFDRNGFFLLNDTDQSEIVIDFSVDAGSFEGSMSVLGILGLSAEAVTLDGSGQIDTALGGTALVTASLEADLFGTTGLTITDPTTLAAGDPSINETEAYRDFSEVQSYKQTPTGPELLQFENLVYVAQLDTSELIDFNFSAEVDVQIALEGNVLDPITGLPLKIGGLQILPSVNAELVFNGLYSNDDGFLLDELIFKNVRLDASVLVSAIIDPVINPIRAFIDPIAGWFDWLEEAPFNLIADMLSNAFPILGLVNNIIGVIDDISDFVNTLSASGGVIAFGDFDFSDNAEDISTGETSFTEVDTRNIRRGGDTTAASHSSGNPFGVFGDLDRGFSLDLPLLTDPFSAMSILMGNFDEVDLVRARFTLFNIDTGVIDIVDEVLDLVDAPGWVNDIISSVFEATVEVRFISKFEIGYDLSGIVNFVNTFDPERLLDGVFIDASPGSLIDAYFGASLKLDLGIAGLNSEVGAGIQLGFNDPNGDGKLRIPELIAVLEDAADYIKSGHLDDALGVIFDGTASVKVLLSVWAGIRLPWPLPDLVFEVDVFDIDESVNFGGLAVSTRISNEIANAGDTAILNVGAMAGASMSNVEGDGDDNIVISGPNSPMNVVFSSDGSSAVSGDIGTATKVPGALIIPAGNGNNRIDMSGITTAISTITYTGNGSDTITLPSMGLHVVFAGDDVDQINANVGATGTYVIFGDGGADTVDIPDGNVIFFGDDDFEMRDRFLAKFAADPVTEAAILDLIGVNLDGTLNAAAAANYTVGAGTKNLSDLVNGYTQASQLNADSDVETAMLGSGNHVVLTGAGNDLISVDLAGSGVVKILSGDGNDTIRAGGSDVFVEAGAGRDLVQVDGGMTEVWGWGKAATQDGLTGVASQLESLAIRDGADILIGGSGEDALYGQLGKDIIQGGHGVDRLAGGIGDDFVTGGIFDMAFVGGAAIDITTFDIAGYLTVGLTIETTDVADGDDVIFGDAGKDVLLGGGGSDTMQGGDGNDVLLGDFGIVTLSSNLIAEGVVTTNDSSANSGTDDLEGGFGNDILIAGAALAGETETVTDYFGSNILIGDFGEVEGARILEAATKVSSNASSSGGADTLKTGRGNDLIIGGEGIDTIESGLGGDIIVGDNGVLDIKAGTVASTDSVDDGDDVITVGVDTPATYGTASPDDLKDIVIGGFGGDTINSNAGGLVAIGDTGTVTLNPVALNALRSYSPLPATPTAAQIDANTTALNLISTIAEKVESTASASDGDDMVTTTGGESILVLGGGGDTIDLADGVNYVLGDDGAITVSPNADYSGRRVVLTTADSLAANNVDDLQAGNGLNIVSGGAAGDEITLGDGDNVVIADLGSITHDTTVTPASIEAVSRTDTADGIDTVILGNGANIAILGGGGDRAELGSGGNAVLGDSGRASLSDTLRLETLDLASGGADDITTLGGDDVIIGGTAGDTVHAGDGADMILGDNGSYQSAATGTSGNLTSEIQTDGGKDEIYAEAGDDVVIAGLGDDYVSAGTGNDVALGDDGVITHSGVADVETIEMTNEDLGGEDELTAAGTVGDNILLGQAGIDTITGGITDDLLIGDLATLTLDTPSTALPGQSVVDRLLGLEGTRSDLGFNDIINGDEGSDLIIGGFGADELHGNAGQDFLVGDSAIVTRSYTEAGDGSIDETIQIDTNFAFDEGGNDTIFGEDGPDVLIGGLGPDLFHGNTADDVIFSDGYAGTFEGDWSTSGFAGETPNRQLLTSNFAGPGAIDVVSAAQQKDSIGAPLDHDVPRGRSHADLAPNELLGLTTPELLGSTQIGPRGGPHFVDNVLSFLESAEFVEALASLVSTGAENEVLRSAIRAAIVAEFGNSGQLNALAFEKLIQQLIEHLLAHALLDTTELGRQSQPETDLNPIQIAAE